MVLTEQKIVEMVSAELEKYLLKEEDGKWDYISSVLFRYGVKHKMSEINGKDCIAVLFNNDTNKNEITWFLYQMGYNQDDSVNEEPWVCFSKQSGSLNESLDKSDLKQYIKSDKEFEKRVKKIAADVVTELFRVLWQHNAIFKNLGK